MVRALVPVVAGAAVLFGAACADDEEDPPNGDLGGPAPPHVTSVTPEHDESVTNEDLFAGDPDAHGGVCAGFRLQEGAGLGERPDELVRMSLNGTDVTAELSWVMTSDFPPSLSTGCYTPPEPLSQGYHVARVDYTDLAGEEFSYGWRFRVTD